MMDEDDFEEWPIITINSSINNASQDAFRMPSAEEVAEERERELECERELRRLREGEARGGDRVPSGGDETETAALADAVTALRVERAASPSPRRAALLADMARRLPPAARALLDRPDIELHLPELLNGVCEAVRGGVEPSSVEEGVCVCAVLCACALSAQCDTHTRAVRALHHVLDYTLDAGQARAVCAVLLDAACSPDALLELSSVLSGGAGPHTTELSTRATERALHRVVGAGEETQDALSLVERVCARWHTLSLSHQYVTLQVVGRHLAHTTPHHMTRVLHTVHTHTHAHDAHTPHALKVMASAARLRLLFRADASAAAERQ